MVKLIPKQNRKRGKGSFTIQMVTSTLEIGRKTNLMEKECMFLQEGKYSRVR